MTTEPSEIAYHFHFASGGGETVRLRFSPEFDLLDQPDFSPPPWTALGFSRCAGCPLDPAASPLCPFARALAPLVPHFTQFYSYEITVVEVVTPRRTMIAKGALQEGTASLIGLVGATCGCPLLAFFRPMARLHLPFASEEETLVRLFATHLLGRLMRGEPATLDGLRDRVAGVVQVNAGMAQRLRAGLSRDALVNGLIILDTFAEAVPYVMDRSLDELRYIFSEDG